MGRKPSGLAARRFLIEVFLPDKTEVVFEPRLADAEQSVDASDTDGMDAIYEILGRRCRTGVVDRAARHNEHQP